MSANPGLLISIEGGEGAGKSTVVGAVRGYLLGLGHRVTVTREPGGTEVGERIRALLLAPDHAIVPEAELLLMFASRAQLVKELVEPALARGETVLADRFTDASYAYQGGGRGIAVEHIRELERRFVRVQPDFTLLLDVGVEQGMARAHGRGHVLDRIERERGEFFHRVRDAYLARARAEPERIALIDASQSADEVVRQVLAVLAERVPR